MNSDRLEQLKKYHKEDPNDPFILYGLAMEYWKFDLLKTRELFEELLRDHPNYLATYYQSGHLYEDLDEIDLAKSVYAKGIQLALKLGNKNTERELKNALQELEFFD